MNEQANWVRQKVETKRIFVEFVRGRIDRELGYEDWQEAKLKEVYNFVNIPAGGWWIPYATRDRRGNLIGARVYNSEGLLVNQFEFEV